MHNPNDPKWMLYLEKVKRCSIETCSEPESRGKAWIKLVNPRTGKKVPWAWTQKMESLERYIPVCKQCCSENKHLELPEVAQNVAQNVWSGAQHNIKYVAPRPTQPIVPVALNAYIGPAPKWLRMKLKDVCVEASVRFDMDVRPEDLLGLAAPEEVPSVAPAATPIAKAETLPEIKLKEGYVRCLGCQVRGVLQTRLEASDAARCSICKPEQFHGGKPID